MKPINIVLIASVILLVAMMIFGSQKQKTSGNIIKEDVFWGVITNINLEPGILDGKGVYDKSCNMIGNGLTQCDAGIQTEEGLLNFNYKHNMNLQQCISEGDNLKVEILEGGEAIVTRI